MTCTRIASTSLMSTVVRPTIIRSTGSKFSYLSMSPLKYPRLLLFFDPIPRINHNTVKRITPPGIDLETINVTYSIIHTASTYPAFTSCHHQRTREHCIVARVMTVREQWSGCNLQIEA